VDDRAIITFVIVVFIRVIVTSEEEIRIEGIVMGEFFNRRIVSGANFCHVIIIKLFAHLNSFAIEIIHK